jgi:UDP:flavonoid glycosyltransferase YjiC (YdhE family)
MEIILVSFGSAGDINPYIALGTKLRLKGHHVKFITNGFFKNAIVKNGIEFHQVGTFEDYNELSTSSELFHSKKAFEFVVKNIIHKYMRDYYYAITHLVTKNSIIVSQSISPGPRLIHEKLSVPLISLNLQPFTLWSYIKPPVFPGFRVPEYLPLSFKKKLLVAVEEKYIDKKFGPEINQFLSELHLPHARNFFSKWLYSPQMVIGAFPEWFAQPQADWPENTHLTGFIALDEPMELPADVKAFLENGSPPLVFTFGSAMQYALAYFQTAAEVVKELGLRAIFITSFPEKLCNKLPNNILVCSYLTYPLLFPYIDAVIHHGGIGTIAHAIAAGKPQLCVPFAHDQPDNAFRVEKMGLGFRISPNNFNKKCLIERLQTLKKTDRINANCLKYSRMVNFDESIEKLVNTIESFALTI